MTAVDHAELKRVEERIAEIAALFGVPDGGRYLNDWKARAEQHAALLSEIEGLKAELEQARAGRKLISSGAMDLGVMYASANERAAEAERQLAALRTQAPDSWRPIETAPKDGTRILVGHSDAVFDAWWEEGGGNGDGWVDGCDDRYEDLIVYEPTHWMPLPAAPALRPQTAESGT